MYTWARGSAEGVSSSSRQYVQGEPATAGHRPQRRQLPIPRAEGPNHVRSSSSTCSRLVSLRLTRTCREPGGARTGGRGVWRGSRDRGETQHAARQCTQDGTAQRATLQRGPAWPSLHGTAAHQQRRLPGVQPRERVKLCHRCGEALCIPLIKRVRQALQQPRQVGQVSREATAEAAGQSQARTHTTGWHPPPENWPPGCCQS